MNRDKSASMLAPVWEKMLAECYCTMGCGVVRSGQRCSYWTGAP